MTPSGQRDRSITIQQAADSEGTSGVPIEDWTTLVSGMPASKIDAMGRERFVSNQESARFDTTFVINYRPDMDPDLVDVPKSRRIIYSGRVFDIVSATQIGRREGIEIQTLASSRLPAVAS